MSTKTDRLVSPDLKTSGKKMKKELTNTDVEAFVDEAMLSLFNSMMSSLGLSFNFGVKTSITRARDIVSGWAPQSYESDQDVTAFCRNYVFSQFFDKFISVDELNNVSSLKAKAARKFLETNNEGLKYDAYALSDPRLKPLLDKMRCIIGDVLSDFSLTEIYENCKHGPNSTSTIPFSDAYLDVKDGDWSGTRASLQQFIHYLNTYDLSLREYLIADNDVRRSNINGLNLDGCHIVDSTSLSLVPKKFDSLRSMCPEPTIPAFHAQGVGNTMAKKLLKIGIDLATQPLVHRDLARLGSLYPELNIATEDWSGASDRIWIALCEAVMTEGDAPKYFNYIMNVCRTTHTDVSFDGCFGAKDDFADVSDLREFAAKCGELIDIGIRHAKGKSKNIYYSCVVRVRTTMIGTMGNAITFPLQTLLFYAFLSACNDLAAERLLYCYGPVDPSKHHFQFVSSFGDDGITDSRSQPEIEFFAELLGWKLNVDKSHFDGAFRESCGGDYFMGRETRALMLKRPPTNPRFTVTRNQKLFQAWLYIAANAACAVLERFGVGPYYIDQWLLSQHEKANLGKVCVVPPNYPEGSGLRVVDFVGPEYYRFVHERSYPDWGVCGVGYGLDPDRFHIPRFNCLTRAFEFRRLASVPNKRKPLQEYSYYCRTLAGTHHGDILAMQYISFFELGVKTQALLTRDGETPMKECRLYKVIDSVLSWNESTDLTSSQ